MISPSLKLGTLDQPSLDTRQLSLVPTLGLSALVDGLDAPELLLLVLEHHSLLYAWVAHRLLAVWRQSLVFLDLVGDLSLPVGSQLLGLDHSLALAGLC